MWPGLLLVTLVLVRLLAAWYAPINDCDETFNYVEPLHFLVYGRGLQTWEYSPVYGLRSYLYLLIHWMYIQALRLVGVEAMFGKLGVFFCLRAVLGLVSAVSEYTFYQAIQRRFGSLVANLTLFFLMVSAGPFHAFVSFLPQSFTAAALLLCFAAWIDQRYKAAIFFMGLASIVGWPFAVILGLPLAADIVFRFRPAALLSLLQRAVAYALLFAVPTILVDFYYYRRWLFAPLRIALYNSAVASGSDTGATLYGEEPWHFYLINLFLNFNVGFLLALAFPILFLLSILAKDTAVSRRVALVLAPLYLWLALFSWMPHKEERFMFVIYPLVALAAAASVGVLHTLLSATRCKRPGAILLALVLAAAAVVSALRATALVRFYGAPITVYSHLQRLGANELTELWQGFLPRAAVAASAVDAEGQLSIGVCVGKEWHRFPSHFFLPTVSIPGYGEVPMALSFLPSGFGGQLPRPFSVASDATSRVHDSFNDRNKMNATRIVRGLGACHFIVDLDLLDQEEPHYRQLRSPMTDAEVEEWRATSAAASTTTKRPLWTWRTLRAEPFLDSGAVPSWARAFYLPGPVADRARRGFAPYQLLQRTIAFDDENTLAGVFRRKQ